MLKETNVEMLKMMKRDYDSVIVTMTKVPIFVTICCIFACTALSEDHI